MVEEADIAHRETACQKYRVESYGHDLVPPCCPELRPASFHRTVL